MNHPVVCLLIIGVPAIISATTPTSSHCRCVPNQWEGILTTTDREFDLKGGQAASAENNLQVHYDFENKRFAMTDLKTGSRGIANYETGYKYVIRDNMCHGIHTGESMEQMCLPESATFIGHFRLGTSVPIDLWEFDGPMNTSMKTAVLHEDCIPASEEIYVARGGYVSVTSSVYLNVRLELQDEGVFTPPDNCVIQPMPAQRNYGSGQEKRSPSNNDALELLKALRQMYILN